MAWATITIEGGLFPPELLESIATGAADGQSPRDFGLPKGRRLSDEIQAAFSDVRARWGPFQRRLRRSRESTTTLTRSDWAIPLFEVLGFTELQFQRAAIDAGGESFAISHLANPNSDAPPIHIAAIGQDLGRRAPGQRRSAHAMVQDFLNRSDALWGIVTNGEQLRLLRDSVRLAKPTYLQFDLAGMIEGNQYAEFALLYRLLHVTRFPRDGAGAHDCLLERYYTQGLAEGGRVRDKLRGGVERALERLGTGFLQHTDSGALRRRLDEGSLDATAYYRQLLRLIYRLLFLMVAEERSLLFSRDSASEPQRVYGRYYSATALRARADRQFRGDSHGDLWLGLQRTFTIFREEELAQRLELHALNGELFGASGCADLESACIRNEDLLAAVRLLSTFDDDGIRRRVNYAALDVEELGSVYESLLDFHPQVRSDERRFDLVAGSERKQTGSYYTPRELVHELIESALVPVVEERLAAARGREAKRSALLALRVCDPAAGSGHFLLAAARRIATELARVETGEEAPSPEAYRDALRQVIRRCIYAVDKNALAVDLCKVALWIEGHNAGRPLSFLDHHIKHGDSLVGVYDLQVLHDGVPDGAYKPLTGDDKGVARGLRKRNKEERAGQQRLDGALQALREQSTRGFAALSAAEERTPDDVQAMETRYERLRRRGTSWWDFKVGCDLWTHAFFAPLTEGELVPTTADVRRAVAQPNALHASLAGAAVGWSAKHPFFHWPLEFPEVFESGGFDVVLGNPPWGQLQPEEIKFFRGEGANEIADMAGTKRKAAIEALSETNPRLDLAWRRYKRSVASQATFSRMCGRFPLAASGKINTYPLFAEASRGLMSTRGRTGLIIPTGIATDDATKRLFSELVSSKALVSLHGFENEELVFPGVHHATKFGLLTLGDREDEAQMDFVFFARRALDLKDEDRHVTLRPSDFALMNPNTHTCPTFRSGRDAEITRTIYEGVPVLIDESDEETSNPWAIAFRQGLFNMTSDFRLFRTEPGPGLLPLYEAKMVHQFDHRFGTYEGQTPAQSRQGKLPELDDAQHEDPALRARPRYWIAEDEVDERLTGRWGRAWLLGWRDITTSVAVRTVIAAVIPRVAVGHKLPLLLLGRGPREACCLLANLDSFCLDYAARQKVGGTSLAYFLLKQFPVFPPSAYECRPSWADEPRVGTWIAPRVVELTYTAWDLQPFARDCGYDGPPFRWDEERRFLLRCELDAAFFHLYGVGREDVAYIMGTFPIVRRNDEKAHGEYRTKRVILEIYDAMVAAEASGTPYRTRLDPPPADPAVAHGAATVVR